MTKDKMTNSQEPDFKLETVNISELHPHPRNYRGHPDDQINHLMESIKEHGFYRNIVIARDGTILAGHGVVKAVEKMGIESVPVIRLDVDSDDTRALKVLAGDNEIGKLGEIDDRALSEMLKEIKDFDIDGLLGTGYDEMMLANLAMVTRPASEIKDFDAAAAWAGMPEYEEGGDDKAIRVMVTFRSEEDKMKFASILGLSFTDKTKATWWPAKKNEDYSSVKFLG